MIFQKRIYPIVKPLVFILVILFTSCESEKRPEEIKGEIPEEVSFTDEVMPIFDGTSINIELSGKGRACTDCHSGKTPPDLTADNAYIELNGGGYIDIDNPEDSKLYTTMAFGSMKNYTNTTDTEIILKWISQGALEN